MPKRKPEIVFLDGCRDFKAGDPRPEGYLEVHAWAEIQIKAGINQTECPRCKRWHFPQEHHDINACKG